MKTSVKKLLVAIVAISMAACHESEPASNQEDKAPEIAGGGYIKGAIYYPQTQDPFSTNISSVSIKNGQYSIDSAIALADANKKALVAALTKDELDERKTVAGIPEFIRFFLDSISGAERFDMVDPGKDYPVGWVPKEETPAGQLVCFGMGKHVALLSFRVLGQKKLQNVAIIKFEGETVVDFWFEVGADPGTKKDEIIAYLKGERNKNRC